MVYWFKNFIQVLLSITRVCSRLKPSAKCLQNRKYSIQHKYLLRVRNFNPVTKRNYTSNIKPGYILMQKATYLEENYKTGTRHSKLFNDFTGKSIQDLEQEGTFYFGLGFSYQWWVLLIIKIVFFFGLSYRPVYLNRECSKNQESDSGLSPNLHIKFLIFSKPLFAFSMWFKSQLESSLKVINSINGKWLCDFKDRSGTFNTKNVIIPGVGEISAFRGRGGETKTTDVIGLIKLAVNHWRVSKKRVLPVSTLHKWRQSNPEVKNNLPSCPDPRQVNSYNRWSDSTDGIFHSTYSGPRYYGEGPRTQSQPQTSTSQPVQRRIISEWG